MNSFQAFDILILIAVAGYLIYRLYNVLGQKTGFEGKNPEGELEDDNIVPFKARQARAPSQTDEDEVPTMSQLEATFGRFREIDEAFSPQSFMEGAQIAFEMIVKAFNEGDSQTLENMLSPALFKKFSTALKTREANKEVCENVFLRIQSADIEDASLKGSIAKIKMKYVSEQIFAIKNKRGELIEGDPDQIEIMKDLWTFSRDLRSSNLNWTLVATESAN